MIGVFTCQFIYASSIADLKNTLYFNDLKYASVYPAFTEARMIFQNNIQSISISNLNPKVPAFGNVANKRKGGRGSDAFYYLLCDKRMLIDPHVFNHINKSRVTVIGEAKQSEVSLIPNGRQTVRETIVFADGLKMYAKRDNNLLIREQDWDKHKDSGFGPKGSVGSA